MIRQGLIFSGATFIVHQRRDIMALLNNRKTCLYRVFSRKKPEIQRKAFEIFLIIPLGIE